MSFLFGLKFVVLFHLNKLDLKQKTKKQTKLLRCLIQSNKKNVHEVLFCPSSHSPTKFGLHT